MAYEILTESYGRRLPKITAEADSTDDLATLGTNYAEGSTCVIGDKTYSLDKVQGWVEHGSGGSGGGGGTSAFVVHVVLNPDDNPDESGNGWVPTVDEPIADIIEALDADIPVVAHCGKSFDGETPSGYFVISLSNYYPAETVADVGIDFVYINMVVNDASTTLSRYWLYWYNNGWAYEEKTADVVSTHH